MLGLLLILVLIIIIFGRRSGKEDLSPPPPLGVQPSEAMLREKIALEIEAAAMNEDDNTSKRALVRAAGIARATSAPALNYGDAHLAHSVGARTHTPVASEPLFERPQPQSNAVTLLYVGAFLFITAVIIFIAAPVLGGAMKTFLVAATALAFFGLGLWLYGSNEHLKPAGQTFVVIGMLTIPLVGVTAYNFLFDKQSAYGVWLATSLLSMAAYIYALSVLRTTLIGYMSVLSALSLVESSVLSAGLPLYYISWTMSLLAVGLSILSSYKHIWPEQKEPLNLSAQILLPAALLTALVHADNYGYLQLAAALLLGAGFYAYCGRRQDFSLQTRSVSFAVGALLGVAVVPTLLAAQGQTAITNMTAALATVATLSLTSLINTKKSQSDLLKPVYMAIASVPFLAILPLIGSDNIVAGLGLWLISSLTTAYALRQSGWLLVSYVPILALPMAVRWVLNDTISYSSLAWVYILIGLLTLLARYACEKRRQDVKFSISGLLYLSLFIGFCYAATQGGTWAGVFLVVAMVLLAADSFVEKSPEIFAAAYSGLFAAVGLVAIDRYIDNGLIMMSATAALALGGFGLSELTKPSKRVELVQLLSVAGMYWAAASTFFTGSFDSYLPAAALAVAGLLCAYFSRKSSSVDGESLGYITFAGAASWALAHTEVTEVLAYSYLWTLTFAFLYIWRSQAKDSNRANSFLLLALMAITVPLSVQVLDDAGGVRGWLLVIQSLVVMLTGMSISNKTTLRWGLVTAVAAVIYQLRDLTFLMLGAIGLSIIGIAVWLLNKETKRL